MLVSERNRATKEVLDRIEKIDNSVKVLQEDTAKLAHEVNLTSASGHMVQLHNLGNGIASPVMEEKASVFMSEKRGEQKPYNENDFDCGRFIFRWGQNFPLVLSGAKAPCRTLCILGSEPQISRRSQIWH